MRPLRQPALGFFTGGGAHSRSKARLCLFRRSRQLFRYWLGLVALVVVLTITNAAVDLGALVRLRLRAMMVLLCFAAVPRPFAKP